MLQGINPLLTGELLAGLDAMGHGDTVCLADAHFPADALAERLLVLPGLGTPELVRAVRTVLPLDDAPAVELMRSADGTVLPVQQDLLAAAGVAGDEARFLDRFEFYDRARAAYLVVRAGETRPYGNVLLRKGVVSAGAGSP